MDRFKWLLNHELVYRPMNFALYVLLNWTIAILNNKDFAITKLYAERTMTCANDFNFRHQRQVFQLCCTLIKKKMCDNLYFHLEVNVGVHQGSALSPFLPTQFLLVIDQEHTRQCCRYLYLLLRSLFWYTIEEDKCKRNNRGRRVLLWE